MRILKNIWHPEAFHNPGQKRPYFEGWFFKLVDAQQQHVYSFIPGVYLAKNSQKSHAFVMVLDGQKHNATFQSFPLSSFKSAKHSLDIKVGANRFCSDFIKLCLDSFERSVHGSISFSDFHAWPVRFTSPGAMGWYAFVPFMQCYHGVLSFDHRLYGELDIDGKAVDFTGGRGYTEKDWGTSFPSAYVWMQSNHFSERNISVMASVAHIPWLNSSFTGFLIGLWQNGMFYRLTTYTGAQLEECAISDESVYIRVTDNHYKIILKAARTSGGTLHAPYDLGMVPKITESLDACIDVTIYRKSKNEPIFQDTGVCAGLDVNGKLQQITT